MLEKAEVAEPGDAMTPEQAIKDRCVGLNLRRLYSS